MRRNLYLVTIALAVALAGGCKSSPSQQPDAQTQPTEESEMPEEETAEAAESEATTEATPEADDKPADFAGAVERRAILQHDQRWYAAYSDASVDQQAAEALAKVAPGAEVDVYLGVWCGDSVREVTRFWKALDVAGEVSFEVDHIGLDRQFEAGEVSLEGLDVIAVPTFIVYRDGEEVGRVVERSPENIETHLLGLLTGEATGMISATR